MKEIGNGAEAKVFLKEGSVLKKRISKSYRVSNLDKLLRIRRTRREAKIIEKLDGISPKLIDVNEKECEIEMEFLDGPMLKDVVDDMPGKDALKVFEKLGQIVAKMHDIGVAHGDLTTSNMIHLGDEVKLIDFGLSFVTDKVEHLAVDIHLFKQALESKHHTHFEKYLDSFLEGYKNCSLHSTVLERLEKVEKRGRYKRKE